MYTAEHIDVEKFEEGMDSNKRYQEEMLRIAEEKATAFYSGYTKCLDDVISMLHCSNYENSEKKTKAYIAGANAAFYELCKELDVGCQDILDQNISIDQKAAMLVDRIQKCLYECNEDVKNG